MRVFFDTEFMDHGATVELVSLGAVREDGEKFYAENAAANLSNANGWVVEHVLPLLEGKAARLHTESLRFQFWRFCTDSGTKLPEFWAYYGAYDWFLVVQLMGGFQELGRCGFPGYFHELMTLQTLSTRSLVNAPKQERGNHHALHDALHVKRLYEHFIIGVRP